MAPLPHRVAFAAAWLAVAALAAPGAAGGAEFNQFIGFGDSTMDSGYFRHASTGGSLAPAATGGTPAAIVDGLIANAVKQGASGSFTGAGVMNTTLLAARFGLTALPVTIAGGSGTNYANGSAQTASTTQDDGYLNGFRNNVPAVAQISNYLAAVNDVANPNALYMISTGANDLFWMQTQQANLSTQQLYQDYMKPSSDALAAKVAMLQAGGARTIVVLNLNEYARLVDATGTLSPANAVGYAQSQIFGAQIWSSLAAAGVNFVPADISGLFTYVSRSPTSFGFTPASVLASNAACGATSGLLCSPDKLVSPDAEQTHLWADHVHLTTAGQTIEVDYITSLLTAPSQISMVAESAVQDGLARTATIQGQIELSGQHRGANRINVWASGGAGSLDLKGASGFPTTSGIPFRGTIGTDYQLESGVILGVAVTAGGLTQTFSSGGNFDQVDEALSLYAAYRTGPLWGNAIATAGLLQNQIDRQVTLGRFVDQNSADTDGQFLALGLRGGWDFNLGPVTTGPVAGLLLQQVRINGFTETGTSGVTALSFGSQTRNSTVSQLGWRASMDIGSWQPFAELKWNHEWADRNRTITTSLNSIAAPAYVALAAPVAANWASAAIGANYSLTEQVAVRGTLAAVFVNPQATSFGGALGLNISF